MSVLIPKTVNAWLSLIPWNRETSHITFFEAIANALDGQRIIPGLMLYPASSQRDIHELAHLIQCKDEHVLDPYWGFKEFVFREKGTKLSVAAGWTELEVFCIEGNIKHFLGYGPSTDYPWPFTLANQMRGIMECPGPPTYHYSIAPRACEFVKKWDIPTCYLELVRKAQLIQRIT